VSGGSVVAVEKDEDLDDPRDAEREKEAFVGGSLEALAPEEDEDANWRPKEEVTPFVGGQLGALESNLEEIELRNDERDQLTGDQQKKHFKPVTKSKLNRLKPIKKSKLNRLKQVKKIKLSRIKPVNKSTEKATLPKSGSGRKSTTGAQLEKVTLKNREDYFDRHLKDDDNDDVNDVVGERAREDANFADGGAPKPIRGDPETAGIRDRVGKIREKPEKRNLGKIFYLIFGF